MNKICGMNKALEKYYKDARHEEGRASECKSYIIRSIILWNFFNFN